MKLYEQKDADGDLTVDLRLREDGGIEVFYHDLGSAAQRLTGDSDYERALSIPHDQLAKLAMHLLSDRFSGDYKAQSKIEAYCEEREIETQVWAG